MANRKLSYYVRGEHVCKSAFAYLHCRGTRPRLATILKSVFDGKTAPPTDARYLKRVQDTNPRPNSGEVVSYLQQLYDTVAESLPDDLVRDFTIRKAADPEDESDSGAEASNLIIKGSAGTVDGSAHHTTSKVRFLPPGSLHDQHKQYLALGNPPVCIKTFIKIWRRQFAHLQFRGKRQHAICATCARHRLLIKTLPAAARIKQRALRAASQKPVQGQGSVLENPNRLQGNC